MMARDNIEYDGKFYKAVPFIQTSNKPQCDSCDLKGLGICDAAWCSSEDRNDHQDVVFKLVKENEQ